MPNICQFCSPECIFCEGENDNCNATYGCAEDYFFHYPTNECLLVCPNGYYADDHVTFDCIICADGCELCYDAGYDACTKCEISTNNTPYFKEIYTDTCTVDCLPG